MAELTDVTAPLPHAGQTGAMSETFELRVCGADGGVRVVFVSCAADDIVRLAKLRMFQHGAVCVQVWRGGEHLATLDPPEALAVAG